MDDRSNRTSRVGLAHRSDGEDYEANTRAEVEFMTATEEIIVSGENFIERRIILFPERRDMEDLRARTFASGYQRGWTRGMLMGFAIFGAAAACVWLALLAN